MIMSNIKRKISDALTPYYQRTAFIRDPQFMELAEGLMIGLEACVSFNLPCMYKNGLYLFVC